MAERYHLSGSMGGRIAYLSGELHSMRHEWGEAEKDYMDALSTPAMDREEVENQAKQRLATLHEARKKDIRYLGIRTRDEGVISLRNMAGLGAIIDGLNENNSLVRVAKA